MSLFLTTISSSNCSYFVLIKWPFKNNVTGKLSQLSIFSHPLCLRNDNKPIVLIQGKSLFGLPSLRPSRFVILKSTHCSLHQPEFVFNLFLFLAKCQLQYSYEIVLIKKCIMKKYPFKNYK